jgi:hypothetical protein
MFSSSRLIQFTLSRTLGKWLSHLLLMGLLTLDGVPRILVLIKSWECKE